MPQTQFKQRSDLHLARKVWHVSAMSLVATLLHIIPPHTAKIALTIFGTLFVLLDVLRLYFPSINTVVKKSMGILMREHENTGLAGTSWFIVGLMVIYFTLPLPLVICAVLMTAFVDPTASLVGVLCGKHKLYNHKSWEGFLAAVVAGILVLLACVHFTLWQPAHPTISIIIAALVVALVELFSPHQFDDNLTIPVSAGFVLLGLLQL